MATIVRLRDALDTSYDISNPRASPCLQTRQRELEPVKGHKVQSLKCLLGQALHPAARPVAIHNGPPEADPSDGTSRAFP